MQVYRPCFANDKEREEPNARQASGQLGKEYIHRHPFVIFCVTKE